MYFGGQGAGEGREREKVGGREGGREGEARRLKETDAAKSEEKFAAGVYP